MHRPFEGLIEVSALLEFVQRLIQEPSVLGNEGTVAKSVSDQMHQLSFDSVRTDEVGNVVGVVEGANSGPTLLIDAHMDTVGIYPKEAWNRNPFGGEIEGGKIFGRGSSDMKGALAAMVFGVAGLDRSSLAGRVVVSASVGEESTEGSALRVVMEQVKPDFVVIGESTELRIARAGRGRAEFEIEVTGKSCHASKPHLGSNAVIGMMGVISQFEDLLLPQHTFVGEGVMCLTGISSKPFPPQSMVPATCEAVYERRLVPGESLRDVVDELKEGCVRAGVPTTRVDLAIARYRTYTGALMETPKWYPAWEITEGHNLVQLALSGLRATGIGTGLTSYQFCTNAAYSSGEAKVPTIGFGPSNEEVAHTVDEFVEVEQIVEAAVGYRAICESLLQKP
jgi:putative selenium metabolism hydrolase